MRKGLVMIATIILAYLLSIQACILLPQREKCLVIALFGDDPVLENDDAVGVPDGG